MNLLLHGTIIKKIVDHNNRLYYFTDSGVDVFTKDGILLGYANVSNTTSGGVTQQGIYIGTNGSGVKKITHAQVTGAGGGEITSIENKFNAVGTPVVLLSDNITYIDARDNLTVSRLMISSALGIDFIVDEINNFPRAIVAGCGVCTIGVNFIAYQEGSVGLRLAGIPQAGGWSHTSTYSASSSGYTWSNSGVTQAAAPPTTPQGLLMTPKGDFAIAPYDASWNNSGTNYYQTRAKFYRFATTDAATVVSEVADMFIAANQPRGVQQGIAQWSYDGKYVIVVDNVSAFLLKVTNDYIENKGQLRRDTNGELLLPNSGIYNFCQHKEGNYAFVGMNGAGNALVGYRLISDSPPIYTITTASIVNSNRAVRWHPTLPYLGTAQLSSTGLDLYQFDNNDTYTHRGSCNPATMVQAPNNHRGLVWCGDWLVVAGNKVSNSVVVSSNMVYNSGGGYYTLNSAAVSVTTQASSSNVPALASDGRYVFATSGASTLPDNNVDMLEFDNGSLVVRRSAILTGDTSQTDYTAITIEAANGNIAKITNKTSTIYFITNRYTSNINIGTNNPYDVKFGADDTMFIATASELYVINVIQNVTKKVRLDGSALTDIRTIYPTRNTKYSSGIASGYMAYATSTQHGILDMSKVTLV